MNRHIITIALLAALPLLAGCKRQDNSNDNTDGGDIKTQLKVNDNEVRTMKLTPHDFQLEMISNGKLAASQYADMVFKGSGTIERVLVKNGDHVAKGQALAMLDTYTLQNRMKQGTVQLEQARLTLQDFLIGQGYSPDDLTHIPQQVMRLAMVKSGYEQCKNQNELTRYELQNATLRAPFAGVVANLKGKAHNIASAEPFCRIISTAGMEVEFSIMESELPLVKKGETVQVNALAAEGRPAQGVVTAINPLVDDNGMVRVTARLQTATGLISGMNVSVSIRRTLPHCLVVPKTAVVHRSGRLVVFSVSQGKAVWHYVQTGAENMNECVVTDGLEPGMEIIVAGNQNLSHDAPVKIHN